MELDLNDVALLVRLVQAGSFSQAARERGVPVSTVSRRIARLEARLGTRLLERTTRRLRLTDTGRAYLDHAERAMDELAQGADRLRELSVVPRGLVRMTAPVALGTELAASCARYLGAHPHVRVELDLTDRRVDLATEGFDVALRAGSVESSDLVARQLWETSRVLVASPEYLRAHGAPRRPGDLAKHACIAMRASETGATWELFLGARRQRVSFVPRLLVNELEAARSATITGLGIALLPLHACERELETGTLERVLPEHRGAPGGMWLVHPARRGVTAALRSFIEHLVADLPVREHAASAVCPSRVRSRAPSAARSRR